MAVVVWADWYAITFALISVAMALIALAYMIAMGFHLPKLQAWAKEEFYQALASALIAVLLIMLVSTINTTMTSIYGRDPFGIAFDYMKAMATNLSVWFLAIAGIDFGFALMQSMAFKAMPSQFGFSINPFAGMTTLTSMLSLTMEAILGGMAIMLGQSAFLSFIKTQLSIILPIGIALRSFPVTRYAGGALIAIFLGFYVFYPFLWVFDNAIYNEISIIPPISINAPGAVAACITNPFACVTTSLDIGLNVILWLINTILYITVYDLFIFVFLMSFFNLATVLVLTDELAKIFGSEIDLGGLSGLI